jgi:hypothetical protein
MGPAAQELFPWPALMTELEDVRRQLGSVPDRQLLEVRAKAARRG